MAQKRQSVRARANAAGDGQRTAADHRGAGGLRLKRGNRRTASFRQAVRDARLDVLGARVEIGTQRLADAIKFLIGEEDLFFS